MFRFWMGRTFSFGFLKSGGLIVKSMYLDLINDHTIFYGSILGILKFI
jgi:hypothetical protein